MPTRYSINLEVDAPELVHTQHLHAHACRWLDLSEAEHRANTQAFAISPLAMIDDTQAVIELAVLDDRRCAALETTIRNDAGQLIRVGNTKARVSPSLPITTAAHDPWLRLIERARPAHRWSLNVQSPALSRNRNTDLPLPNAGSIVTSLQRRWSALAPFDLDGRQWKTERHRTQRVARTNIADFDIQAASIDVKGRTHMGFTGRVELEADPKANRNELIFLDTLLALARYCGIGALTTYGLGVVDITRAGPKE